VRTCSSYTAFEDSLAYSSWSDELTWTLIAGIEDDEDIRNGLFPGVGSIGLLHGKPKTHWHYKLAVICFATNPEYQEAFTAKPEYTLAMIAEQRKLWTEKISNKVKTCVYNYCFVLP
jgi:hypothetical protein